MASEAVQSGLGDFLPAHAEYSEAPVQKSFFTHPLKKGWLVPYLAAIDQMTIKRWDYWIRTLTAGRILEEPIPKLDFAHCHEGIIKMFKECMDYAKHKESNPLMSLTNWILWGFNSPLIEAFPVEEDVSHYWHKKFNLDLILQHPADYFMHFASLDKGGYGRQVGRFGYFGTPPNVTKMMTEIQFANTDLQEAKAMGVCDPCCGSGIMLLYASNYSLNLYGSDINPDMVKFAICNGYFYVPWMVKTIECKDALLS